ncbi:MAG: hypothetical protein ABJC05_09225 [Pyrinomonadaceae bacterium]
MRKSFTKLSLALCMVGGSAVVSYSQDQTAVKANEGKPAATTPASLSVAITAASTPLDLARAALAAQGGDKFKNLKSMVLIGLVDLYPPNSAQSIPGKFAIVVAGDRVRVDISAPPAISFKQVFDGQQSYSSIPGVEMPPASKFGLIVLTKFDQPGYKVTELPDKKKQRGFRIADAEGNTTDFYIDALSGRVITYLSPYKGFTFGVENKSMKELDGVLIAYSFTQRLEMPQGAFFAEYKVKDVKLNQPIGDDVFVLQ